MGLSQLVMNSNAGQLMIALVEDGLLMEFFVEREAVSQLAGNIYKGTVMNVLPGMEAAFVDIGLAKNAFLHIDDVLPANLEQQPPIKPAIDKLVHTGQEILVQVKKEPLGTKGARVTTHYSLPGRYLVYMPLADYVGVSRKVEDEAERDRLRQFGEQCRENGEGVILRTVAEGQTEEALLEDLHELRLTWLEIRERHKVCMPSSLLYRELDMLPRVVRDVFTEQVTECIVNSPMIEQQLTELVHVAAPQLLERIRLDEQANSLFLRYGIQDQLNRMFANKVWLDNGGYVVIDQTEALTVIDVNTGKFVGSVDLEQTVFETNLAAAILIARLLRLRDMGGIIIADFIDMQEELHREAIVQELENRMKHDRTKCLVVGWTRLGLLEMTRKKVRESVSNRFTETCINCGGSGRVKKSLDLQPDM